MMHMVIAVTSADRDSANLAAPSFGTVGDGVLVFGEGQKRIHRTTGGTWYAICSAQPATGMQPLYDYCFGRIAQAARAPGTNDPNDPGADAVTALPAHFPTALIAEFSLEFQPGHQFEILDGWMLDMPDEPEE